MRTVNIVSTDFTNRQKEILELINQGVTPADIGRKLWIEPQTVKTHLRRMYKTAGVKNRVQLLIGLYQINYFGCMCNCRGCSYRRGK